MTALQHRIPAGVIVQQDDRVLPVRLPLREMAFW